MEPRKVALAASVLVALLGAVWWAQARLSAAAPESANDEHEPMRQALASEPEPAAVDAGADLGTDPSAPCAEHGLALPQGTELRYRMRVTEGTDTQSARYTLRLTSTEVVDEERVDSWLATLEFDGVEEPVETTFQRRCSDARGAEEVWMGLGFAGLTELEFQGWRWPAELRAGQRFGGELRRSLMDQTLRVQREHEVVGLESIHTEAGRFNAWRVDIVDRASVASPGQHATAWVMPQVGLVRLAQPTLAGMLRLELTHIDKVAL